MKVGIYEAPGPPFGCSAMRYFGQLKSSGGVNVEVNNTMNKTDSADNFCLHPR